MLYAIELLTYYDIDHATMQPQKKAGRYYPAGP